MHELKCDTARKWLVAPGELPPLDMRQLDRHLLVCPACAELQRFHRQMDRMIHVGLSTQASTASVRERTRAQLLAQAQGKGKKQSLRGALPWRQRTPRFVGWFLPRRAWLVAPAAMLLAALALVAPQVLAPSTNQIVPAGAAFKPYAPVIAFPMTIDPTRPTHLLAGDHGQVYESWNGGDTWTRLGLLPPRVTVRAVAIDWSRPTHYLVALMHSVLDSHDAGHTWRVVAHDLLGVENMFLIQDPRKSSTFYVGPSVIWRSDDGGQTWIQAGQNVFAPDGVQALTPSGGTLYTGIWKGGVAVSHDDGRTWQRLSAGLSPDVMDVEVAGSTLWAATDHGVYASADGGLHWQRHGPHGPFFTTSVYVGRGYLLAGGKGGVFRSTNGGRNWQVAYKGLPLSPYVYSFAGDPRLPNRVYATLNGDGIFRSDDGGKTWSAADTGLPLPQGQASPVVLFWRGATLWKTDGFGTDPGNLTIEPGIRTAVAAPDGREIAYVSSTGSTWAVRVIWANGGSPRTVAQGSGPPPTRIFWSPTSASLAVQAATTVYTWDGTTSYSWKARQAERLLGWNHDGTRLHLWQPGALQVVARDLATGRSAGRVAGRYPSLPSVAPDSVHLALLSRGVLYTGAWNNLRQAALPVKHGCDIGPWSHDSQRFLLVCPGRVEERSVTGVRLATTPVPRGAFWAPESDTALLYFHHGLWRWSPTSGARLIVPHAQSVQPR